jgi:hypothetical protein
MRIGGPARKHGIPDADIWHGVRNATHKIDIGDDIEVEDLADLRAIAEAAERARRDEVLLTERVALPGRTGGAGTGSPPPWACPGRPPASGSAAT